MTLITTRGRLVAAEPAAALVALFLACAAFGGAPSGIDTAIAAKAAATRAASPLILESALVLTQLGGAIITLGLAAIGALVLAVQRERARAATLLIAVIATRLSVDGLKLLFGRFRPEFDTQLVQVTGLSFPSGHAANGLTTWVLLACLMAPARSRRATIVSAFVIAFVVGATRIVLGVHWLSDVIGGWVAGLLAVMLALVANRRLTSHQQ